MYKHKNTPIWFMRQAGRYLPEYQEERKKKGSFINLCFDPMAAAKVSLQPITRFDFDFIILFSDILVIPLALGQEVKFVENEGPVLGCLESINILQNRNLENSLKLLDPIIETVKILNEKKSTKKLIGFCGAPFTVMNYMIERKTSNHQNVLNFIKTDKKQARNLIKILQEISIEYLTRQIESGADIVKIFDSWAGLLKGREYEEFVIRPNKNINDEIKKRFPKIKTSFFPRGSGKSILDFLDNVNCDIISLDEIFPEELNKIAVSRKITLQGNLSPKLLVEGGKKLEEEIRKIMLIFNKNDHIFNLSHGILPETPVKNVEKTISLVRKYRCL